MTTRRGITIIFTQMAFTMTITRRKSTVTTENININKTRKGLRHRATGRRLTVVLLRRVAL